MWVPLFGGLPLTPHEATKPTDIAQPAELFLGHVSLPDIRRERPVASARLDFRVGQVAEPAVPLLSAHPSDRSRPASRRTVGNRQEPRAKKEARRSRPLWTSAACSGGKDMSSDATQVPGKGRK